MSGDGELERKLRRLRREAPARDAGGGRREGLPKWLATRLRAGRPVDAAVPSGEDAAARTLGPPVDLVEVAADGGRYAARERAYALDHRHGAWRLEEALDTPADELAFLARDPALADLDLRRALYLDVETTGLAGGAGTLSFLVALGGFHGRAFTLWQGFLLGPEDERALLQEVADRIAGAGALVSFFGKSFDRHRLEDKMRLHGIAPPFEGAAHLDLYHPLGRLYRTALPDGRLQTMERALCDVAREDDLPGSHAPEAWFDFLGDRPHRLEDVFRHNADDVLSLVVLAAHLGRTRGERRADGGALPGPADARARALARLHHEAGRPDEALEWTERALERCSEGLRELRLRRGILLGRARRELEALADLEELAATERDVVAFESAVEVAKLAEHRLRDFERAAAAVERAAALCAVCFPAEKRGRTERDLAHRAERLERKRRG